MWALLGLILGCVLMSGVVLALGLTRPMQPLSDPALTVRPAPTATSTPEATPTAGMEVVPTATLDASPTGGALAIGMLVEIYGTGTDGLRLRQAPGLQSATNLVAEENEVFEVRSGPEQADGRTWWYLVNPFDADVNGWGVENYLRQVSGG